MKDTFKLVALFSILALFSSDKSQSQNIAQQESTSGTFTSENNILAAVPSPFDVNTSNVVCNNRFTGMSLLNSFFYRDKGKGGVDINPFLWTRWLDSLLAIDSTGFIYAGGNADDIRHYVRDTLVRGGKGHAYNCDPVMEQGPLALGCSVTGADFNNIFFRLQKYLPKQCKNQFYMNIINPYGSWEHLWGVDHLDQRLEPAYIALGVEEFFGKYSATSFQSVQQYIDHVVPIIDTLVARRPGKYGKFVCDFTDFNDHRRLLQNAFDSCALRYRHGDFHLDSNTLDIRCYLWNRTDHLLVGGNGGSEGNKGNKGNKGHRGNRENMEGGGFDTSKDWNAVTSEWMNSLFNTEPRNFEMVKRALPGVHVIVDQWGSKLADEGYGPIFNSDWDCMHFLSQIMFIMEYNRTHGNFIEAMYYENPKDLMTERGEMDNHGLFFELVNKCMGGTNYYCTLTSHSLPQTLHVQAVKGSGKIKVFFYNLADAPVTISGPLNVDGATINNPSFNLWCYSAQRYWGEHDLTKTVSRGTNSVTLPGKGWGEFEFSLR